jgi:hypothetical protein
MFSFSRHNYYVQEKLHSTRTPEEQHASPHRGNMDVRQYFYDVYVKSAESRSLLTLKTDVTNVLRDITK